MIGRRRIELDGLLEALYSYGMSERDNLEERARLARNYAAMSAGELQKLALNPQALTEPAWEALEDELEDRNLELPVQPSVPEAQFDLRKLVVIRQFRDLPEALLAKGSLESTGIECYLRDDNLVRLDWFVSNFIGGVKLCVHPEDVADAQKLLNEPILEGLYVEGIGLYENPRCPQCQSLDINFQERSADRLHQRVPATADPGAAEGLALPQLQCGMGRSGRWKGIVSGLKS